MYRHTLSLMLATTLLAVAQGRAQDKDPSPWSVGGEIGFEFLDLPGIQHSRTDLTNESEQDISHRIFIGYETGQDVLADYLGDNQVLELSWKTLDADARVFTPNGSTEIFIDGSGSFVYGAPFPGTYDYEVDEIQLKLTGYRTETTSAYAGLGFAQYDIAYRLTNAGGAVVFDHDMDTDVISIFVGKRHEKPIRKNIHWVCGGELGIVYADSDLKARQDPNSAFGGISDVNVSTNDSGWSPRLKAEAGLVYKSDGGQWNASVLGRADYFNNMPFINSPNGAGEVIKISNGDTLSFTLALNFTWLF